jgi:cold shock CspA family protein
MSTYQAKPVTGKIKWFSHERGFEFIRPHDNDVPELFFHRRDASFAPSNGQAVTFVVSANNRGPRAVDLRLLDSDSLRALRPRENFCVG